MQYWKKIKSRKASGLNEIPPEILKTRNFGDILLSLCNTTEKWTKGRILPFLKKGDFGITKNSRATTLTAIVAKDYENCFSMIFNLELGNLEKNGSTFLGNQSTILKILTIYQIIKGLCAKNFNSTLLFVDFSWPIDFIHKGKQILLAYDLPKEMVTAIRMLYKNKKAVVC